MEVHFKPVNEQSEYSYFRKKKIPVIYYFGTTEYKDYQKPTDTPDHINYDILEKRTKFIFHVIWQLAYQKKL